MKRIVVYCNIRTKLLAGIQSFEYNFIKAANLNSTCLTILLPRLIFTENFNVFNPFLERFKKLSHISTLNDSACNVCVGFGQ